MNTPIRIASLALAALIMILSCAEVILRVHWGLGNPVLIQSDPNCGYTLAPNQFIHRFSVDTHTNRYGMRSPDFAARRSPSSHRVVFLGDSITYGTSQVDQKDIFATRIQKSLSNYGFGNLEILNASAGAWAIGNELGYLKSRGTFKADEVILVLNSGDLSQPFSTLQDVGDALPTRKPATAIGEVITRYIIPKLRRSPGHRDAGTATATASGPIVDQNLQALSSIKGISRAAGAGFAMVYIPFRRDVKEGATASVPSALLTWAQTNNVCLLDLTRNESDRGIGEITLPDKTHFNSLGNRLIAEAIEPWLASLIASAHTECPVPSSSSPPPRGSQF